RRTDRERIQVARGPSVIAALGAALAVSRGTTAAPAKAPGPAALAMEAEAGASPDLTAALEAPELRSTIGMTATPVMQSDARTASRQRLPASDGMDLGGESRATESRATESGAFGFRESEPGGGSAIASSSSADPGSLEPSALASVSDAVRRWR